MRLRDHLRTERDGVWLAAVQGEVHGAIALDGTHAHTQGAHLRWFIMSDALRGKGMGTLLLCAALAFADAKAYPTTFLWTFDQLPAARHLYEKHGFVMTEERRGTTWGKEVNEQKFVRRSVSM